MTPRQLRIAVEAHNENTQNRIEDIRQELYLQASLMRTFIWSKRKPPSFEKLFGVRSRCVMTDEEMYRQVLALNAALGGIDKRGETVDS